MGRSSEISPSELHRATTATPLHLFVPACPKTTQIILFGCTPLHLPILLPSVLSSRPRFRTPCFLSFTAAASNPHSKLRGSLPRCPSFFFWDVRELPEAFTPRGGQVKDTVFSTFVLCAFHARQGSCHASEKLQKRTKRQGTDENNRTLRCAPCLIQLEQRADASFPCCWHHKAWHQT